MTQFELHAHFHTAQEIKTKRIYAAAEISSEPFEPAPGVLVIEPRRYVETALARLDAGPRMIALAEEALSAFITITSIS